MVNKKLFFYCLASLAIISFLLWLYNYSRYGTLEVSNNSGTVTVSKPTSNGTTGAQVAEGTKRIKVKLEAGEYILSTASGTGAISQTAYVRAHKLTVYDITPHPAQLLEPVLSEASQDISIGNRIVYLNPIESKLYEVDKDNNLSAISSPTPLRLIKWADSTYGIAQDNNGNLYEVNGTRVRDINLPGDIKQKNYIQYAVTRDRKIYISSGGDLYFGDEQNGFKKIRNNINPATLLVAGRRVIALINDGDASNKQDSLPSITVISGSSEINRNGIGSFVGAWSPNDDYLAISSQNGGEILNAQLKHAYTIPQDNFKNPVWLSNSLIAYTTGSQLWEYNIASQRAEVVGVTNAGETFEGISPTPGSAYIYTVIDGANSTTSIRRLALNGTQISATLVKLTVFLPISLPECSAGYINFTRVDILMRPYNSSQTSQCVQDVKTDLANDQLNINDFSFNVGPVLALD